LQSESADETENLVKFVYNFDQTRKAMREMNLDVDKLPLGSIKIERIKKSL
jgi:hypothetical protein